MSLRQTLITSLAFAAVVHIAGCDRRPPVPQKRDVDSGQGLGEASPSMAASEAAEAVPGSAPVRAKPPTLQPPVPNPAPSPGGAVPAAPPPPPPAAAAISPQAALARWAVAIQRRDWLAMRALWGNHGADSGLSPEAFARRWQAWSHPRVTIGAGQQEGAAGSIFYTAPVRIEDGTKSIAGQITIRRVNDVDGATPEQLRWHLDLTTRAPWTDPNHN